jgi:hypothetical protein
LPQIDLDALVVRLFQRNLLGLGLFLLIRASAIVNPGVANTRMGTAIR